MSNSLLLHQPLHTAGKLEFPTGEHTMTPYRRRKLENLRNALTQVDGQTAQDLHLLVDRLRSMVA